MTFLKRIATRETAFWIGFQVLLDLSWMVRDRAAYTRNNMSIDYSAILAGVGCAPEQYRIGVLWAANVLHHATRASLQQIINADDLICSLLTSVMLCLFLQRILDRAGVSAGNRSVAFALLAGANLFYLDWCLHLVRPETTVSILYACLTLYLLDCMTGMKSGAERTGLVCVLLAAGVLQSFCRVDISFAAGAAELLVGLIFFSRSIGISRGVLSAMGAATAGTAGGIQLYLSHVRFPGHHYCGPVFVLMHNLGPVQLALLAVFLLPFVATSAWLVRRWSALPVSARVGLLACALHFCLYVSLGNSDENRIYVPLLMAMSPWCAYMASVWLEKRAGGGFVPNAG